MLEKRLAIVQGPPGTGKTHVSVIALQQMLQKFQPGDPPIIVSAHTNHALDQLLRHIANFEPEFVRIGGMSQDVEIIKPRTLYEIKRGERQQMPMGGVRFQALARIKRLADQMVQLLDPLNPKQQCLSAESLVQRGIITDVQHQSLIDGAAEWVNSSVDQGDVVAVWLGDNLLEARRPILPQDFGLELEEPDLEFEQLKGKSFLSSPHRPRHFPRHRR